MTLICLGSILSELNSDVPGQGKANRYIINTYIYIKYIFMCVYVRARVFVCVCVYVCCVSVPRVCLQHLQ